MWISQEGPYFCWCRPEHSQGFLSNLKQLTLAGWDGACDTVAFYVLPYPFVRVQVRRVGRQVEQFNAVPVLLGPFPGLCRLVVPHVVNDKEYLAFNICDEILKEAYEPLGV